MGGADGAGSPRQGKGVPRVWVRGVEGAWGARIPRLKVAGAGDMDRSMGGRMSRESRVGRARLGRRRGSTDGWGRRRVGRDGDGYGSVGRAWRLKW